MKVPKDYRNARKKFNWLYIHKPKKSKVQMIIPKSQAKIHDFIKWEPMLTGKYLYRFPRVKYVQFHDFAENCISKLEWDMIHYLPKYDGAFENLFEFNSLAYFDDLQERLENSGISFKSLFIKDILIFEFLRLNLGFKDFRGIEKMHRFTPNLPVYGLPVHSWRLPSAADLSFVLKRIPAEDVFAYYQLLVDECISCGLIIPRILIWDGQFIRANSNNNKKKDTEQYGDPDAGYCRHNGIKKGVGYDPGILYAYCKDRWLPIYFKMFPGNRSDSKAFRETMKTFLKMNKYEWDVIIADSGPYSKKNMEYLQNNGILPIIRSRKGITNQPVKELKKGYYFNTDYIPKGWTNEYYLGIYEFRPMIEQGNSYSNTYYNASRLNTRGIESAIKNRAFIYILELLKALTAYKVGRPDLLMKQSAFESSKKIYWRDMIPRLAEKNDYEILTNWVEGST